MAFDVHELVRRNMPVRAPYEVKVVIAMIVYFNIKPYDADNICEKPYIDGLKKVKGGDIFTQLAYKDSGLLYDDDPKFISAICKQSLIDKADPRIELHIFPTDEKIDTTAYLEKQKVKENKKEIKEEKPMSREDILRQLGKL